MAVKRQARKYVPLVIRALKDPANKGKTVTDIVTAIPFGFDGLQQFCLWLAGSVSRMEKPDAKTPTEIHNAAKVLLSKMKSAVGADHADYFSVTSENKSLLDSMLAEDDIDASDETALADWIGDVKV